ncbi:hypothetical protein [Streptomyces sp. NPDC015130]|uniref:hypothetical protein n=1 Tax=Streptomyces sp. NPDC015130 TaxID=3364940 RepID=UPI0036F75895
MDFEGAVWRLMRQEEVLGEIVIDEADFPRLSLVAPSGPVADFLLHISDDRAWFRWSDEPFEDG